MTIIGLSLFYFLPSHALISPLWVFSYLIIFSTPYGTMAETWNLTRRGESCKDLMLDTGSEVIIGSVTVVASTGWIWELLSLRS